MAFLYVQAYKTFRALLRLTDPEQPWGEQALVLSRMLFENFVTARWIATKPEERITAFRDFEFVAEVQSALIKNEITEEFLDPTVPISSELASKWYRSKFFEVLPRFRKKHDGKRLTRREVLSLQWTTANLATMVRELGDTELQKSYEIVCAFANSVAHGTVFSARSHISEDMSFQFEPQLNLALSALTLGMDCLFNIAMLVEKHLGIELRSPLEQVIPELKLAPPPNET